MQTKIRLRLKYAIDFWGGEIHCIRNYVSKLSVGGYFTLKRGE